MVFILEAIASQIPEHLSLIFEIGAMIVLAGVLGFVLRSLKQPLIPAYVIAGIILGPLSVGLIKNYETILVLSEIGIAFLLFYAGTEISFKKLKEVGRAAVIGGTLQIALLFAAGFLVSTWLGFAGRVPIYTGLVVAFSSTMVVLKLLADKRELNSLHGRIILGILLIQDIAAIIALAVLTTDLTIVSMSIQIAKAIGFIIVALVFAKIINPIFKIAAKSTELLLLISITLLFIFGIGSYVAGLSMIIGAFFAGLALANSDYKTEIQGRILPLRDFFAVLFFVALGMQLSFISSQFILLLAILIALAMIFKPLVIMMLTRLFGYSRRTSFFAGNSLAQTSEFSLIIATVGLSLGYISRELFSSFVLLTIVTMVATTYIIKYDKKLFDKFSWPLSIFRKFHTKREVLEFFPKSSRKVIIFGCHRIGSLFLRFFIKKRKDKKKLLVIDYDPDIIKSLIKKRIPCIYGDFANTEVLEKANLKEAEVIASTIPDKDDNKQLIKKVKEVNSKAMIVATANSIDDAQELYGSGADYVLLPKVITGEAGFGIINGLMKNKKKVKKIRRDQIRHLKDIHKILYK